MSSQLQRWLGSSLVIIVRDNRMVLFFALLLTDDLLCHQIHFVGPYDTTSASESQIFESRTNSKMIWRFVLIFCLTPAALSGADAAGLQTVLSFDNHRPQDLDCGVACTRYKYNVCGLLSALVIAKVVPSNDHSTQLMHF